MLEVKYMPVKGAGQLCRQQSPIYPPNQHKKTRVGPVLTLTVPRDCSSINVRSEDFTDMKIIMHI